jgi:hypothetical protein
LEQAVLPLRGDFWLLRENTKTVLVTALLGIAWVGATGFGLRTLLNYESSPGRVGSVRKSWPADSAIQLADDRPTLVMLAHPQCPCTRASMGELAQVMARVQGKVNAYVLFYTPQGSAADWKNTDLRRSAAQIPGVTVLSDVDGAEARRFGAETSGHTFLFDSAGRLLFNGGITESRGHSGDNAGENAILSLVNNHVSERVETFVFGCSLGNQRKTGTHLTCLK